MLPQLANCEEASPLNGAIASTVDEKFAGRAARINDLNFRQVASTTPADTNGSGLKELSLHLQEHYRFKIIFLQNHKSNGLESQTWNDAKILLGTDTSYLSSDLTACIFFLNDSTLQTLPLHC